MARDDGIRYGAGGKVLQEIVELPSEPVPVVQKQEEKKIEVLEETIKDTLPAEPEDTKDEDI